MLSSTVWSDCSSPYLMLMQRTRKQKLRPYSTSKVQIQIKLIIKRRKTAKCGGFSDKNGPSGETRTPGILLPKQARYQLRHTRL